MKIKKRYIVFMLLTCFLITLAGLKNSSAQNFTENEIKAAYIIKLSKFIRWPDNYLKGNIIILGIYGNDPFENILHKIIDLNPNQSENWLIEHYTSVQEIKDCNILYLNTENQEDINAILHLLSNKPIVTIGNNIPYFCERGGILNFIDKSGTANKFQMNNLSAKNKKIIIDSRLLAIAKLINSPGY